MRRGRLLRGWTESNVKQRPKLHHGGTQDFAIRCWPFEDMHHAYNARLPTLPWPRPNPGPARRAKGWASSLFVVLAYYSGSHVEKCAVPIARAVGEDAVYVAVRQFFLRTQQGHRVGGLCWWPDMTTSHLCICWRPPGQLAAGMAPVLPQLPCTDRSGLN